MNNDFKLVNPLSHSSSPAPLDGTPPKDLPSPPRRFTERVINLTDEPFAVVLWRIIRNRKWTIAAFALIVVAVVMVASLLMKPKYEAVGRVVVIFHRENDTGVLGFKGVGPSMLEDPEDTAAIDTQMSILRTDALAVQVINQLHLDKNPTFAGNSKGSTNQDRLVRTFHHDLSVSNVKGTRVIEIRFRSRDPKLSADVVNSLTKEYVNQFYRNQLQLSSQISDFLADQLKELKAKVGDSQQKLLDYQKENGLSSLDDTQNIVTTKLNDLNKDLTAAEADRVQKEVDYRLARSGQPELIAQLEPDSLLTTLRAREATLQNQIAQTSVQLGPANPKMVELSKQLSQARAAVRAEVIRIGTRIAYAYRSARNHERMLRRVLDNQKKVADNMNARALQAEILQHDFEANRKLYDDLLQKQKEISISSSLKSSNIWIVDPARVPKLPVEPNLPRNFVLSIFAGVIGGTLLAFGMEKMKRTISTLEQAQMLSPLPSLGVVPLVKAKSSHGLLRKLEGSNGNLIPALVSFQDPMSLAAESYKAVLTSLLLSQPTAPKVVQVTSALPGEGKTSVCTNLAILLARLHRRVLLVDADLRRPSIHLAMRLKPTAGLGALLRSSSTFEEAVISSAQIPNLFILPAGLVVLPDDTESLVWSLKGLVEGWRIRFDHIVIDTPPVLPMADAVRVSAEADSVILVVRSGQTSKDAFLRAQDSLIKVNARLAGFVLNGVQMDSSDFQYYRSYYGYAQPKRLGEGA
jgi:polysaccharide biosynthesis transport protein